MNNYVSQNNLIGDEKKVKAFADKNLNAMKVVMGSQMNRMNRPNFNMH